MKTRVFVIVEIACAVTISCLIAHAIAERNSQNEAEKVTVLVVAQHDLCMGMLIEWPDKLFCENRFTKGSQPENAIRTYEELKGRRLNKPLKAGQCVTTDELTDNDKWLAERTRAVTLSNVHVEVLHGWDRVIRPDSHVDVCSKPHNSMYYILQNIPVQEVRSDMNPDQSQGRYTVSIRVTPEEAEQITLAQRLGTIFLILRSFAEEN